MKLGKRVHLSLRGEGLKARLLRGGLLSIVVKIISTLAAFLVAVLLARILGPEKYGVYSFVLSVIMLLAIPIQSGLPHLIVREVSKAYSANNFPVLRGILRWNLQAISVTSLLLILVVILISWMFQEQFSTTRKETFLAGLLLMPLGALLVTQGAVLRGLGKVVLGQIPNNVIRPLFLVILLFVANRLIQKDLTAQGAMALHVFSVAAALLISTIVMLRLLKNEGVHNCVSLQMMHASWFKSVLPLTLVAGFQLLNSYADVVFLGIMRSDEEVGVYRVVAQMVSLVTFGLFAINQILHPDFASLHVAGQKEKLQQVVRLSAKLIFIIAIPPALLFILAGAPILGALFGNDYMVGSGALCILSVGQLANAGYGSVGALLNMTGHERDSMKGMMVAAGVNIVLNLLLIPKYGMSGAAIATAVSMFIWNALLRRFVKKRIDIETIGWRLVR